MEKETNNVLRISITNKCNFNCIYCPEYMEVFEPKEENNNQKELSIDDIIEIVKDVSSLWIKKVSLTWGEPLLRKDIGVFCKKLKEEWGIDRLEITTNAFLLNHFLNDENSKYVDLFKISFDSPNKNNFNNTVRVNAYDVVLNNIKMLIKLNKNAVLNVVISKENISELDELITLAESIWIDLSLLDAVCHPSNKDRRKENFYDFSSLRELLGKKYRLIGKNEPSPQVKKRLERIWVKKSTGVSFPYYDTGKIYIRLKDSKTATRRDSICEKCSHFCQEWLCMMRLTLNGWMTDCQSITSDNWFRANKLMWEKRKKMILFLQNRFPNSVKDNLSFKKFLEKNKI